MGVTISKVSNESITEIMNKELIKVNIKQLQEHAVTGVALQKIGAVTENGNIIIRGINMANIINISLESYQKTMNTELLKTAMDSVVDTVYKTNVKPNSLTVSSSVTEVINKYKTSIRNDIEKNITNEQINRCLASSYNSQEITAVTKNGDVTIENVDMINVSTLSAKCLGELMVDIIAENNNTANIKQESKTDIVPTKISENLIPISDINTPLIIGLFSIFSCLFLCLVFLILILIIKR